MNFPNIDPYIFKLGPLGITYYSLSYVIGILLGWRYMIFLAEKKNLPITRIIISDFITYFIIGMIIGGRLGYVLFYDPAKYLSDPISILKTYEGGMSFHGAFIGVILSIYLFCKNYKIDFSLISDLTTASVPIGLFLGRIANFINGELYGRSTETFIGIIFPRDYLQIPRHPSQLYESFLEGFLLFLILYYLSMKKNWILYKFRISACFLVGYGVARFTCEFFREPDSQLGFIIGKISMGQILTIPMIILGIITIYYSIRFKDSYKISKDKNYR